MSAIGPKQTWSVAMHMSAFGGKADIVSAECPLMTDVARTALNTLETACFLFRGHTTRHLDDAERRQADP
jgi:hypothetical protein